jgi:NifU-like protein involved in Fe-S cluster formation
MEYSAEVRRRFAAAAGARPDPDARYIGEAADRTLHFWVRFRMRATAGTIEHVEFDVFGCPDSVAAADLVAERLRGRSLESAGYLDVHAVAAELGVPVEKLGKLLRIEDAVRECVRQAREATSQ